jgi:telomere length regulation protein
MKLIGLSHPKDTQISNVTRLFHDLGTKLPAILDFIVEIVQAPEAQSLQLSTVLLRSLYASITSLDLEKAQEILDSAFERFADELFIRHTPVIQQEHSIQTLLLAAGHVHRVLPLALKVHARSSHYLNGVSKHIASSSSRVRWLGMIVATGISSLIDRETVFGDLVEDEESKWYLKLITIEDKPAKVLDIDELFDSKPATLALRSKTKPASKPSQKLVKKEKAVSKIIVLAEEDSDLVPYPKPDSDPEDEDEDPTLINRDKPRAPVYIRDLLVGLQETEKYDKHEIALQTAAPLIRRKTGFGKEVSDHSEALATTLMNLSDQFELENFSELRHEALIATILADPATIAKFTIAYLFEADLSLQQRTSILTALGLSAREIAGFKDTNTKIESSFPSKKLPSRLHAIYSDNRFSEATSSIEQATLQPLALEAADKLTGPNALKVRTFSSRMAVEQKKKKPTPNVLAQIVADSFFFPLTSRWWVSRAAPYSVWKNGQLLPTYLRTLALLLHSAGPYAMALPQLTREAWDVFLSVRQSLSDRDWGIVEAALFGILVVLELNEKETLARDWAREVVEGMEWAKMVMEATGHGSGEGDSEEDRVRRVAAGVVVKSGEVIERWGRLMGGVMMDI